MSGSQTYVACSSLPVSVEQAFAYHEGAGALERLIPPWMKVTIEHSDHSLQIGSRVIMKTSLGRIPIRWVAEHTDYDPPRMFADTQLSGPLAAWDHRHDFQALGASSLLRDSITYRLPFGPVGRLLGSGTALRTIERMFAFRHRLTRDDLTLQAGHAADPMTIAISGSSGMIGSHLTSMLTLFGHSVRPLVRTPNHDDASIAPWHSDADAIKLAEVDAVVHLAGKPIANERWSHSVKEAIRESRVARTRELCESLASLDRKPSVLIVASATGIYGDRGDETLDEQSGRGTDYLASVATDWEQACEAASDAGIRVVHVRLGVVLSPKNGALAKMILPTKLGGGALGSGKQWWSWIALDDAVGAIYHTIMTSSIAGAVNLVSPEPCTNRQFARTLASVMHRPALVPAPAFALRLGLGEMADALLLASTRVVPEKLLKSNYRFRFTQLDDTLRFYFGCTRLESAE